jgi:hypothetical protein
MEDAAREPYYNAAMPDVRPPMRGSHAPLSGERLTKAWDQFRLGGCVPCPYEDATLALAVDASAGAYRFICTCCGVASPWFESDADGLRVRDLLRTPVPRP